MRRTFFLTYKIFIHSECFSGTCFFLLCDMCPQEHDTRNRVAVHSSLTRGGWRNGVGTERQRQSRGGGRFSFDLTFAIPKALHIGTKSLVATLPVATLALLAAVGHHLATGAVPQRNVDVAAKGAGFDQAT